MVAIIGGEPAAVFAHWSTSTVRLSAQLQAETLRSACTRWDFRRHTQTAVGDDYFSGYAHIMTQLGSERGWSAMTRARFDAWRGPTGALFVGDAETVAEKILAVHEALGGILAHHVPDDRRDAAAAKLRHASRFSHADQGHSCRRGSRPRARRREQCQYGHKEHKDSLCSLCSLWLNVPRLCRSKNDRR